MPQYRDPVIAKVIEKLNAQGPAELKNRYFFGDPLVVGRSFLPACFISKDSTKVSSLTNAEDENRMYLVANVVYDLTRDFNQAFDNINAANTVYEVMEGRDSTYKLKPTSIVYVLRKNQALDTNLWINVDEAVEPDYGVRAGVRGDGIFTVEGVVRFTVVHHEMRPV